MNTYRGTAKRWPLGWEIHINDLGVTQSRTLATAEKAVREYIVLALDLDDEDGFDVEITPELDGNLATEAAAAREATRHAAEVQREAADKTRKVARELKATGLSGADVAAVLGVSPQRVSQLINS